MMRSGDGQQAKPHLLTITLKTDSNKPALNCVFSTITKALKKKDAVTLIGLGTFKGAKKTWGQPLTCDTCCTYWTG
jgi:nucleoid DNA-binding protein